MNSMLRKPCVHRTVVATAGFTLIELLVSITVVGMLSTSMVMAWRVAASAFEKVSKLLEQDHRAGAVQQLIEGQIGDMVPVRPWLIYGRPEVFFQGERNYMRFVSRYSLGGRTRGWLVLAEYQLVEKNGITKLLFQETPIKSLEGLSQVVEVESVKSSGQAIHFKPIGGDSQAGLDKQNSPNRGWQLLIDNLDNSRLEYFVVENNLQAGRWIDTWTSGGDSLPRGVAIRLGTHGAGAGMLLKPVVAMVQNYERTVARLPLFLY
ncbi:MAG: prepilin-type N-terminal cleavage/methylation domain-containing protein [Acidobacteria bacterium]|nr:prepilin-type N-terminal cleavage/methylation domain-containing protein [Acidobacteriota bacterium]